MSRERAAQHSRVVREGDGVRRFPKATITNRDEFRTWCAGSARTIDSASHELLDVSVKPQAGEHVVDLVVVWRARTTAGKALEWKVRQRWTAIGAAPESLEIRDYGVTVL